MNTDELPKCELCGQVATAVDHAYPNAQARWTYGIFYYRDQFLCFKHALERKESNTARVEDLLCLL